MSCILADALDIKKEIFQPSYNKAYGITYGFVVSVLFCSKIRNSTKEVIYILYIAGYIDKENLINYRLNFNEEFFLSLLFQSSKEKRHITKKFIRNITGLNDKSTFNKYFNNFLLRHDLHKKRKFNLKELYLILNFWQGEGKFLKMKAFSKAELSKKFTNKNYELLSTTFLFDSNTYKKHDFISPKNIKEILSTKNDLLEKDKKSFLIEEGTQIDHLKFCFYVYLYLEAYDQIKRNKTYLNFPLINT